MGLITKSFKNLDSLAKEMKDPTIKQQEIDNLLKQLDGSLLTEHKYTGHTQFNSFKHVIDGNKKNHKVAHRNAKFKADIKDQNKADKHFAAASHFHYLQHMIPKTTLLLIMITKILNSKGIFVIFESASQATWSRLLRKVFKIVGQKQNFVKTVFENHKSDTFVEDLYKYLKK